MTYDTREAITEHAIYRLAELHGLDALRNGAVDYWIEPADVDLADTDWILTIQHDVRDDADYWEALPEFVVAGILTPDERRAWAKQRQRRQPVQPEYV